MTTIHGYKIYNGNRLKKFIKTSLPNLNDVYLFQDTISEFALYKSLKKKINIEDYHEDFIWYARRGIPDKFRIGISFNPDRYIPEHIEEIVPSIHDNGKDEK